MLRRTAHGKRLICVCIAAVILFASSACTPESTVPDTQAQFDEYMSGLPAVLIEGSSPYLRFSYIEPENAGITPQPPVLAPITKEKWNKMYEEYQQLYTDIEAFDTAKLNEESQLTQQILLDSLERNMLLKDFYYLYNNNLGSYLGEQAQLPLLLTAFTIKNEIHLEEYFHLVGSIPGAFEQYVEDEKVRQEQGVGMSQDVIDLVIEQCVNLTTKDHTFLYDVVDVKIDNLDSLGAEEKAAAKERNRQLVDDCIIKAYSDLGEALGTIDAPTENSSLADLPQGKEYYAALLRCEVTVDMTPEEAKEFLEERYDLCASRFTTAYLAALRQSTAEEPDLDVVLEEIYQGFGDPQEIVEYLTGQIKADYPDVGAMQYRIQSVPEAMEDNFSPAAFLTPPIDKPDGYDNLIYINNSQSEGNSLFGTLVHESIPGHMYQSEFVDTLDIPDARKIIESIGYVEGWATYVELHSYEFFPEDQKAWIETESCFNELSLIIMGLSDIGVNYEGWDQAQLKAYLEELFMIEMEEEDLVKDLYLQLLETPCNTIDYILTGELFSQMRENAESKLGDDFSAKEFHEVVLSLGAVSMPIVEQAVDDYVNKHLEESNDLSSGLSAA